jgi:hypothetical protein
MPTDLEKRIQEMKQFFKKFFFVSNVLISQVNTQTMQTITCRYTAALLCCPLTHYTLAGFEPGMPVPKADAMSTAPRRQGKNILRFHGTSHTCGKII